MPILDNNEIKKEEKSAKKIKYPRDILGDVTVFVNQHIREVRYLNYGLGALGVVLILKNTYVLRTFTRVQDIPYMVMNKGIKLRGHVLSQDVNGLLRIKHIPWLNIKPKWLQDYSGTQSLPVELAHINVTPAGRHWLQENLVGKKTRFVVFDVQRYPDKALSAVYIPKILKNVCVNEELVRLGLCKVLNDAGSQMRIESPKQIKLLRKLIELESKADSKGIGLWKVSNVNKEKHIVIRAGTAVKNFVTLPWKLMRRGFDLVKKVFKK